MADKPDEIKAQLEALAKVAEHFQKIMSSSAAEAAKIQEETRLGLSSWNSLQKERAARNTEENEQKEKLLHLSDNLYEKGKQYIEQLSEQVKLQHAQTVAIASTVDVTMRGLSNVRGAVPNMKSMLSGMPGGGLLSFFLMGMEGDEKWRAKAAGIAQTFNQIGGNAAELTGKFKGMVTEAATQGIGIDYAAAAKSFIDASVDGNKQLDQSFMDLSTGGILKTSIAMDRLMNVADGTFAALEANAIKDFGNGVDETASTITRYAMAAKSANINTIQFMGGVIQSAQVLKLYQMDLASVADWTLKITQANKEHMGPGKEGFALEKAQAGMSGMLAGVAGLSEGIRSLVAARTYTELGKGEGLTDNDRTILKGDALAAMLHSQRGFTDFDTRTQQKANLEFINQLGKLALELKGNESSPEMFLQHNAGMNAEGAHFAMRVQDLIVKAGSVEGATKLMTPKEKKDLETFKKGAESPYTAMEKSLSGIEAGLTQVSNGLLGAILAGVKSLILLIQNPRNPGPEFARMNELMGKFGSEIKQGLSAIGHGVGKSVGGAAGEVFDSDAAAEYAKNHPELSAERKHEWHPIYDTVMGKGFFTGLADDILTSFRDAAEFRNSIDHPPSAEHDQPPPDVSNWSNFESLSPPPVNLADWPKSVATPTGSSNGYESPSTTVSSVDNKVPQRVEVSKDADGYILLKILPILPDWALDETHKKARHAAGIGKR